MKKTLKKVWKMVNTSVNDVLDRLKIVFKVRTDTDLAIALERKPSTISSWRDRNTADWDLIFEKCVNKVNLNWLVYGIGTMDENTEALIVSQVQFFKDNIEKILRGIGGGF